MVPKSKAGTYGVDVYGSANVWGTYVADGPSSDDVAAVSTIGGGVYPYVRTAGGRGMRTPRCRACTGAETTDGC